MLHILSHHHTIFQDLSLLQAKLDASALLYMDTISSVDTILTSKAHPNRPAFILILVDVSLKNLAKWSNGQAVVDFQL